MNKDILPKKVIVSLTSFPEAIPYAIKAIRSILEGSLLPDKVVLYLDTYKVCEKYFHKNLKIFNQRAQSSRLDLTILKSALIKS